MDSEVVEKERHTINTRNLVLENQDLLREIGKYVEQILPLILSLKYAREAIKPLDLGPSKKWIVSLKKHFANSLEMLEWAQSLGCDFNSTIKYNTLFCYAAAVGSIEVLKWAHSNFSSTRLHEIGFREDICDSAARNGQLETLQFLRSLTPPCRWHANTSTEAARGGHLQVLRWIRAQEPPCPWDSETSATAAAEGHLPVLQWLNSQEPPCPRDSKTCSSAARSGHLKVLQWLRAQNPPYPWDSKTSYNAARAGHLHVLKWLRTQEPPCEWDQESCFYAARNGHLDVLKWLRGQDPPCPWDQDGCLEYTKLLNSHEIVQWIQAQEN